MLGVCSGRVERLQRRGGLHLSSDELVDREVSNVFRSIAQQLRGQRTLYGTVMTRVRPSPSGQQADLYLMAPGLSFRHRTRLS